MEIILASSSPRRRQILSSLVPDFRIITPDTNEIPFPGEKPAQFAIRASTDKAAAVNTLLPSVDERLIIAADTIVTIDDIILGKPSDQDDAVNTLRRLSGREHHVITAICLIDGTGRSLGEYARTAVRFKKLSHDDILSYLETIEYRDKAGSYAFQDGGSRIIESLDGSVTNVIGFPLRLFYAMAVEMDITGELFIRQAQSPLVKISPSVPSAF